MEYHQLIKNNRHRETRKHSFANLLGRLEQGYRGHVKGTDTMYSYHISKFHWIIEGMSHTAVL